MTIAATPISTPSGAKSDIETSTIRAISWRLIPFLVLAYFFSYLDRVNLGFAALTMNAELKFTPLIFAWGAGIFFIGYFIFEVPSCLASPKPDFFPASFSISPIGTRRNIARDSSRRLPLPSPFPP